MSTEDMVSQEQFKDLRSTVMDIASDMKEIKGVLKGSKTYGQKGYIDRIELNEQKAEQIKEDVRELKEVKKKIIWYAAGATTVAGLLGGLLTKLIMDML